MRIYIRTLALPIFLTYFSNKLFILRSSSHCQISCSRFPPYEDYVVTFFSTSFIFRPLKFLSAPLAANLSPLFLFSSEKPTWRQRGLRTPFEALVQLLLSWYDNLAHRKRKSDFFLFLIAQRTEVSTLVKLVCESCGWSQREYSAGFAFLDFLN